jgi:Family of unknown function (DUF6533)
MLRRLQILSTLRPPLPTWTWLLGYLALEDEKFKFRNDDDDGRKLIPPCGMHQHGPLDLVEHAWRNAVQTRDNAQDPLEGLLTLESIWTIFEHLHITRYLIVASFALGFYDYFLTLTQERAYVWRSRPSVVRNIYFFVRYSYFPIGVLTLYGECLWVEVLLRLRAQGATDTRVHHHTTFERNSPYLYWSVILYEACTPFTQSLPTKVRVTDWLFASQRKRGQHHLEASAPW